MQHTCLSGEDGNNAPLFCEEIHCFMIGCSFYTIDSMHVFLGSIVLSFDHVVCVHPDVYSRLTFGYNNQQNRVKAASSGCDISWECLGTLRSPGTDSVP